MTRDQLRDRLENSRLFTDNEIDAIIKTVGQCTVGNAIIACEIIGIELTGNDVDILIG